ncbi:unnamed protein product [Oikopleura dioica]|uniref:Protein disulfide-isomerase n=1 Tax=Oikopleura dioica TaxID=34765 RepID=E4YGC9_OIKDI|nr:unnamed protein product [Oikopleura dioica]
MKAIIGLLALVAAEITTEGGVLVGTKENFDEILENNDFVLVEFYAPWCGHCKSLAPEYESAAGKLAESNPEIKLVKIDATEEGDIAGEFDVGGYPTLKFFKNGNRNNGIEYGGGRQADDIVSWLIKKSGPAAIELSGADAAKAAVADNDVIVVINGKSDEFMAAADSNDDVTFAILDEEAAAELKVDAGKIALFKTFDDGRVDYTGADSADDISAFVNSESLPLVSEFNDETAPKIFGGDITQHVLLFAAKSDGTYDENYAAMSTAAKDFKGKTLFVVVDCDVEDNSRVLEFFGLTQENCPAVRLIQMGDSMAKFKPETEEITATSLSSLVEGVESGAITRHLMSEDIPESNDGPVFTIVGKNFEETVNDPAKHVLLEFYAPWCGHCKALEPTYEKLGKHFADRDDVIIAKTDATANEFDGVDVQGFPTIKFFPKGEDADVIEYEGDRSLEALILFVESDGTEGNEGGDEDEDYDDEDYEDYDDEEDYEDYDDEGHDEL